MRSIPQKTADPSTAPTEVCITVDTEFSIGGAFGDPVRYRPLSDPLVECAIGGRGEGLDFLLQRLRDFAIPATFFIEVLQCYYFGGQPMGRAVEHIAAEGHDLQLHLHPGWLAFREPGWGRSPRANDDCAARSHDELAGMIEFGIDQFRRWGLVPPIALRAGGFCCGAVVYQAMLTCGLTLSSNVGLAVRQPQQPELCLASGTRSFDGVLEAPALSYREKLGPLGSRLRILAITSTSWDEMQTLLWAARCAGISPVVVLTHPFEFVKRKDFRYRELRRDHINRGRLERLLDFLARNRESFSAATFTRSGSTWLASGERPDILLEIPARLGLARLGENAANTLLWHY